MRAELTGRRLYAARLSLHPHGLAGPLVPRRPPAGSASRSSVLGSASRSSVLVLLSPPTTPSGRARPARLELAPRAEEGE